MTNEPEGREVDSLMLRFTGDDLHELHAAHVAEVLQGVVGIAGDFSRAGVFGDGPAGSEVLVRPAREGSFEIEVFRAVTDPDMLKAAAATATAVGAPSLGTVLWWATKSARAGVKDFDHLGNGNVKVVWQDDTAQEIPLAAWQELQKRKRRRKKHLHQIMTPLSDDRVAALVVDAGQDVAGETQDGVPTSFTLDRMDYVAVRPDDEIKENHKVFEVEAQMSAIDFDNAEKWRVKTKDRTRTATVEDKEFLGRVASGLAIRKSDIFRLRVREDTVAKNGRTRRKWTVLKVERHKRAAHDDDA